MPAREYELRETIQNKNEKSSNHFLFGVFIGGVVGAAAALLLSPKTGKELRGNICTQAGSLLGKTAQLRENATNKSGLIISKTSSFSQGLVQQSTDLINKAKKKTNTGNKDESEINYIPIGGTVEKMNSERTSLGRSDIQKKIEEAKKALDEEENKVKQ